LTVKLNETQERYRKDMGNVKELLQSIREKGQIQPIVINRQNVLVAGGRRLAACILGQLKVRAVYADIVNPLLLREWELEENMRRKDFTPGEEVLATRDIHLLKQKIHGESSSGKEGGWTLNDTAGVIGKTRGSVIADIQLAEMIDAFPMLKNAKSKSEIKKASTALEKVAASIQGVKKHEQAVMDKKEMFQLIQTDAVEHMLTLAPKSINILCTDPLYGIDAGNTTIGLGGKTGGITSAGYKIEDSKVPALFFYEVLAKESFRFCTDNAHGYIFTGPEHFYTVRDMFLDAGWRAYIKPMIWIKNDSGQTNVPYAWPSSCYEMFLYVRKDASRLVKEGMPDFIQCPPVPSSSKTHPWEKPLPLIDNMLQRVSLPGQTLYDPFMGSGVVIEAAVKLKLFPIGVDISTEAYAAALGRMANY
jgi:ParB family transcriptional regulator, chromosome partitioning protein